MKEEIRLFLARGDSLSKFKKRQAEREESRSIKRFKGREHYKNVIKPLRSLKGKESPETL